MIPVTSRRIAILPDAVANQIAGAALWMLTPIVKARINSRVTNNFQDAAIILRDISSTPRSVAERLRGSLRQEFERVFVGNQPTKK